MNFRSGFGQEQGVESQETDAALIARSLSDRDAFVPVFRRHYDEIARYLCRRMGPALGEELAAETFTRAFAQRARYDSGRADARPWLYGIATNVLRRQRRFERRQLRAYARTGVDPLAAAPSAPDDERELAALLSALKPADRDALLLFAWADLDYEEIAAALAIPVGTVRSRLHRARKTLRRHLSVTATAIREEAANG